jgi:hypothetical protein
MIIWQWPCVRGRLRYFICEAASSTTHASQYNPPKVHSLASGRRTGTTAVRNGPLAWPSHERRCDNLISPAQHAVAIEGRMLVSVRLPLPEQRPVRIRPRLSSTEFDSMPSARGNSMVGPVLRRNTDNSGGLFYGLPPGLHNCND